MQTMRYFGAAVFVLQVVLLLLLLPAANCFLVVSNNPLALLTTRSRDAATAPLVVASSTKDSDNTGIQKIPRLDLYDEIIPKLWASRLVYTFAALVQEAQSGSLYVPDATLELINARNDTSRRQEQLFPRSFTSILELIEENKQSLKELASSKKKNKGRFQNFDDQLLEELVRVEEATPNKDTIWLESFDCLQQEHECVYGIVRDDNAKRFIVTFRGSVAEGTTDWARNLQVQMTEMNTPTMLSKILNETGEFPNLQEKVLVHSGFYEYLFDNKKADGEQKFDRIRNELKAVLDKHPDYTLYIVGHSLGAALASLIAFKFAGSGKEWIPKPIVCISFESPMAGGVQFRDAFQVLEKEGLLRYIRVTNQEDFVPAIPPFSLRLQFWKQKLYKHVGMHLNLFQDKYDIRFPNKNNGFSRAWGNNFVLKRTLAINKFHSLALVQERLEQHQEELETMYIDDLYFDPEIVGEDFHSGEKVASKMLKK